MPTEARSYESKPPLYFASARRDFIDRLDRDPRRAILEIGCGDGSTGAYAKNQEKCGLYVGVELTAAAAKIAAPKIDRVYNENIETFNLPEPAASFDVLIAGEVLEHLIDPWKVLSSLHPLLRAGALVLASSPNVAHHSVIRMLLRGHWELTDSGPMDRTHLRWFTPHSYAQMFRDCGFKVLSTEPLAEPSPRQKVANFLTGGYFEHVFVSQIVVVAKA